MSRKLKVGTKVRVLTIEQMSLDEEVNTQTGCRVTPEMKRRVGKIITIRRYAYSTRGVARYDIEEDNWTWTSEMFKVIVLENIVGGELL